MQAIAETIFDIVYLITVISIGITMIRKSPAHGQFRLFGIMAVILGCGDAFHLIPRVIALCTTGLDQYTALLGFGKCVTSITMTIFYVLLYYIWRQRYQIHNDTVLTVTILGLAFIRILLCLMPQNQWLSSDAPLSWGIYRNIPFAIIGLIIIILFFRSTRKQQDHAFRWMWLTILLSFGFYIPVVLWADSFPLIGMLMIPKTCAYVWAIAIGYRAMQKEQKA